MSSNDSTSDRSSSPTSPADAIVSKDDRTALIEKAQAFLLSPSVRHEDEAAKRRFLQEKGLTHEEIDLLIQGLPRQPPPIPPRTYPPPPPSNLPTLLASLLYIFAWASGVSAILFLGYQRFLLPRISQSLGARHKLQLYQTELLARLTAKMDQVKRTQEDTHDALVPRDPETTPAGIKSLAELPVHTDGRPAHSLGIVIHCAFVEKPDQRFTVEELYNRLSNQFPGLTKNEPEFQTLIFLELSRSRVFHKSQVGDSEYWALRSNSDSNSSSPSAPPPSFTASLSDLRDALSRGYRERNKYSYTYKALTDLTGFLSRETYVLYGASSSFRNVFSGGHPLGPAEEEVRREIRALKGLVLNRRSFAPSPYRPSSHLSGAT